MHNNIVIIQYKQTTQQEVEVQTILSDPDTLIYRQEKEGIGIAVTSLYCIFTLITHMHVGNL